MFYDTKDHKGLMLHAAHKENVQVFDQQGQEWKLKTEIEQTSKSESGTSIVTEISVKAGGCGIHNGKLWHGSGPNKSKVKPRRGLGIHFAAADARLNNAFGPTLAH